MDDCLTFGDVAEEFLQMTRMNVLVRRQYRRHLETYVIPIIGGVPFAKLTNEHVARVLQANAALQNAALMKRVDIIIADVRRYGAPRTAQA